MRKHFSRPSNYPTLDEIDRLIALACWCNRRWATRWAASYVDELARRLLARWEWNHSGTVTLWSDYPSALLYDDAAVSERSR